MSDDTSATEVRKCSTHSDNLLGFWRERKDWPVDSRKHIFLGRAVDRLGSTYFGKEWIGLADPTHDEACVQRGAIFETLREYLASGPMMTFTRAIKGGAFEPIPGDIWNTEKGRLRFKYCRIDRNKPYKAICAPKGGCYLYLDKNEFEALVRLGPIQHLRIDDADALPKLLAALVRTAAALEITSESPALPAKTIKAKFVEVARRAGVDEEHLSDSAVRYAATFLRPPGAGRTARHN